MPSDLTPERRHFLEILAAHPDGAPLKAIPAAVGHDTRAWCARHFLAQRFTDGPDRTAVRWRLTEFGRAAIGDPEARP